MLLVTWAQLRARTGRLLSSALAVVIAVAFVVATLTLNASSEASVLRAVGAQYVGSDAVLTHDAERAPAPQGDADPALAEDAALTAAAARVRDLPGAAAVAVDASTYLSATNPGTGGSRLVRVESLAEPGPLRWQRLETGRLPERRGEVAVSARAGLEPGATLVLDVPVPQSPDGQVRQQEVRVVGIVDLGADPSGSVDSRAFALPADAAALGALATAVRVAAAPGTDPADLREAVAATAGTGPVVVASGEEAATEVAAAYTGGTAGLAAVLLVFAAVAVVVSGLVIANTFAVLLAQRTRELALLRCVGALSQQVRRGVLLEAAATGLAASALGLAAGVGLAAAVSAVVARTDSPIPLGAVAVPLSALVAGPLLGTGVTVVSALLPARAATRVSPLAALRPMDPAPLRSRGGALRLVAGLLLLLPSTAALVVLSLMGQLLPAVGAGIVSFLAVLLLAQRVVPALVALAGRLLGPLGGVPGRLAAGNALRNPRRTAATATALVVGVTLTTAMVVGAASTRATATGQLDAMYPADVVVEASGALPPGLREEVAAVPGVRAAAGVLTAALSGGAADGWTALGTEAGEVAPVLRSGPGSPRPVDGTAVLSALAAESLGTADGGTVALGAAGREFRVRVDEEVETPIVLTAADLRQVAPAAAPGVLWVRVADDLDREAQARLVTEVEAAVGAADASAAVHGVVTERAALDSVVTTMLLVVTGLLAVAVVIAVIGVGNTLALSVLERRQESGLLRALGLARGQLRATLVWEALLVSGVAAVLGVLLGTGYGLAGTTSVFSPSGLVVLDVPWLQVAAVVVVATAAGVLSSLLPARRAARTSPVAALAA